ncbi:hypothetical protein M0805_005343 [Coniferiporia weirii]|nr:hypothetical protein M0805_005343 [Coniferiporia weirii]
MNTRSVILTLCVFAATASAAPNPNANPIDAGTEHDIAVNNNLACSTGSCNTTAIGNSIVAESSDNSTSDSSWTYSNGASAVLRDTWSPFTLIAAGGLALSTGML